MWPGLGNIMLDMTPKAQATEDKINYSSSKLKTSVFQRAIWEREKTNHRLGENPIW